MSSNPLDALPSFGDNMDSSIDQTFGHLFPYLSSNKASILSTSLITKVYTPEVRWGDVDIYSPSPSAPKSSVLLVFYYGGGLIDGSKQMGLLWKNLGHFFAEKYGYTVLIADYRLVNKDEGATYPSGGEDVGNLLRWIKVQDDLKGKDIFLMGQSSGGTHVLTFALDDQLASTRDELFGKSDPLKFSGVISVSTPPSNEGCPEVDVPILTAYYGTNFIDRAPLQVLKSSNLMNIPTGVKFLILHAELDPLWISAPTQEYAKVLRQRLGDGRVEDQILTGHNHASPVITIGSGIEEGEKWGDDVATWIIDVLQNK
jgi:acetyl esterase/lipase